MDKEDAQAGRQLAGGQDGALDPEAGVDELREYLRLHWATERYLRERPNLRELIRILQLPPD